MKAPTSGLEWRQWARTQIETLCLCAGEANLLRLLADRASATGGVRLGVPLLARQLVLSESQVYRWLARLSDRGLLRTRQQGPGRVAMRELIAVPVERQLSLFDAQPEPAAAAPARVAPVAQKAPAMPWPRMDASLPSHQCEPAVERQYNSSSRERPRAPEPAKKPVLSPSLPQVLEILRLAPDLVVEDYPVDTALRAFPAADHEKAAYRVVTLALEEGLEHLSASRQLWRALERQLVGPAASQAPHGARRRAAPPRSGAGPADRRWSPSPGKYNKAAGLL